MCVSGPKSVPASEQWAVGICEGEWSLETELCFVPWRGCLGTSPKIHYFSAELHSESTVFIQILHTEWLAYRWSRFLNQTPLPKACSMLIHLFNTYLLSVYFVPRTLLVVEDTAVDKTDKHLSI